MQVVGFEIDFVGAGNRIIPAKTEASAEAKMKVIWKEGYIVHNVDGVGIWHNPNYIHAMKIISK